MRWSRPSTGSRSRARNAAYAVAIPLMLWRVCFSGELSLVGPLQGWNKDTGIAQVLNEKVQLSPSQIQQLTQSLGSGATAIGSSDIVAIGQQGSGQLSSITTFTILPGQPYVPGASTVYVKGTVSSTDPASGLIYVDAVAIDSTSTLVGSVTTGDVVEIAGTQACFGCAIQPTIVVDTTTAEVSGTSSQSSESTNPAAAVSSLGYEGVDGIAVPRLAGAIAAFGQPGGSPISSNTNTTTGASTPGSNNSTVSAGFGGAASEGASIISSQLAPLSASIGNLQTLNVSYLIGAIRARVSSLISGSVGSGLNGSVGSGLNGSVGSGLNSVGLSRLLSALHL